MNLDLGEYQIKKDAYGFTLVRKIKKNQNHHAAKEGGSEFRLESRFYANLNQVASAIAHDSLAGESVAEITQSLNDAVSKITAALELAQ